MRMAATIHSLQSRLVHLDMKGAPLNLAYMEKVFPLLKKWGCTGLLLEYEDTFPYINDLAVLAASHAYSQDDINQILKLASSLEMKVIPLVQTFGHFEFVLKHHEFCSLREVPGYPMALCPSNPDAVHLVYKMLDQVMDLHPDIKEFHIGCDEVFHLGLCDKCRETMERQGLKKEQLFFSHVKRLALYLMGKHRHLTVIVWDDMFRFAELSSIRESGLCDLVEPMVWNYQPILQLPANLWSNLSAVFPTIWIASAYKGATGPSAMATSINFHIDNHKAWSDTLDTITHMFKKIQGIVLTGWQRYDHYAVLCELFPQGLPSLAMCLTFVHKGHLTAEDQSDICKDLKTMFLPLDPFNLSSLPECDFPGSSVYLLTLEMAHLHLACNSLFNQDSISGWMNDYNVERGFINPVHVEPLHARALCLLDSVKKIEEQATSSFRDVFVSGVEVEWIGCFVQPYLSKLEQFVSKTKQILERTSITVLT